VGLRIARNAALDELRRRRRRTALETELEDPWCATPEEEAQDEECRLAVRAALSSLEPRERDLVALKFAAELGNVGGRPRARNSRVERRHAGAPRT
jgi:DNA-directed RNA polymerase specialized sigma24 family protein